MQSPFWGVVLHAHETPFCVHPFVNFLSSRPNKIQNELFDSKGCSL